MSKSAIVAIVLLTLGILGGVSLGVLRLNSSQNLASKAEDTESTVKSSSLPAIVTNVTAQACTTPAQVSGIAVNYPSCVGGQCSFVEADCAWGAVSDAANYSVKVTEVESNSIVKNVQVQSTATSYTFPVTQGKTYRCEIAAVNACGTAGPAGSAEALCEIDGLTVSTAPSATPTPTPKPSPLACGTSCSTTSDCQTGLICLKMPTGTGYCANPSYQTACSANPSIDSCCKAPPKPTPPPELPKSGLLDNTVTISVIGVLLVGMAGAMMFIK